MFGWVGGGVNLPALGRQAKLSYVRAQRRFARAENYVGRIAYDWVQQVQNGLIVGRLQSYVVGSIVE